MIKLYKYFFEVDEITPSPEILGESTRSLNGTLHTNRTGKMFHTFEIEFEDLDKYDIGNLYYILNLLYPNEGQGLESIEFVDEDGAEYDVTIPLPLNDSVDIENSNGVYEATIIVETVRGG